MIIMQEPSFAFNSVDVPGPDYRMWHTEDGDQGTSVADLASEIEEATRRAWEQKQTNLRNIVINSHGSQGSISIGGLGQPVLDISGISQFSFLKNSQHLTGTIWIVACLAAAGSSGKHFCSTLAQVSGYQVVAADECQEVTRWDNYRLKTRFQHQIDDFEGTVYGFYAGGGWREIDPHEDIYTIRE